MSCACGKIAYDSQREARRVARRRKSTCHLSVYRCPADRRLWHLTSSRPSDRRRQPGRLRTEG
jgi:hypothetical protein